MGKENSHEESLKLLKKLLKKPLVSSVIDTKISQLFPAESFSYFKAALVSQALVKEHFSVQESTDACAYTSVCFYNTAT